MKKNIHCIISASLLLLSYSCEKIQSYPPEPELSYNSHKVENTVDALGNKVVRIEAKIDFVDGDGDLIVNINKEAPGSDTVSYSRLYILYYQKTNGIYHLVNDTAYPSPQPILLNYEDFMQRDGQNKTFKGTITKFITSYNPPFDTLKLGFYVIDRAYHKSNIVEIPDIPFRKK